MLQSRHGNHLPDPDLKTSFSPPRQRRPQDRQRVFAEGVLQCRYGNRAAIPAACPQDISRSVKFDDASAPPLPTHVLHSLLRRKVAPKAIKFTSLEAPLYFSTAGNTPDPGNSSCRESPTLSLPEPCSSPRPSPPSPLKPKKWTLLDISPSPPPSPRGKPHILHPQVRPHNPGVPHHPSLPHNREPSTARISPNLFSFSSFNHITPLRSVDNTPNKDRYLLFTHP